MEPERRIHSYRFDRSDHSDISPTDSFVRNEPQHSQNQYGFQNDLSNIQQTQSQVRDDEPQPMDRDRIDSMADSLLDQNDYQELRSQEASWNQQPVAQTRAYSPTEVTPLIQPALQEQKTYDTTEYPALPPPMAEFDMDSRRDHSVINNSEVEYQPLQPAPQLQQEQQQAVKPIQLRPVINVMRDLFLWRNIKDSGIIFTTGLTLMAALSYFSFISIFSYLSLAILILTGALVFGRQLVFALQQRSGPHPFQRVLERDIVIQPEYVHQQVDAILQPVNQQLIRMRNLYLADSLAETLKMGLYMYILTYIGSWFNLMTLLMIGWVMAFSVPKLYLINRRQIDRLMDSARLRLRGIQSRIQSQFNAQRDRIRNRGSGKNNVETSKTERTVTYKKTEKVQ